MRYIVSIENTMANCKDFIDNLPFLMQNGNQILKRSIEEEHMNKEINIDLKRCIKVIVYKWWLIIIIGLIFYSAAYLISENNSREDEYTAEATIISASDYSVLTLYSDIITSSRVSEQAARMLNISDINAENIKKMISFKTYSLVLGIHATSADGVHAIMVANAVATVFIQEVNNIASYNLAHMLDEATTVELSYNKKSEQLKFRIIVSFVGIVILCAWIILQVIFSNKVYSLSEIGLDGEIDIIGAVPSYTKKRKEGYPYE
jgi:capsular polysaccharide biosynthesis protein